MPNPTPLDYQGFDQQVRLLRDSASMQRYRTLRPRYLRTLDMTQPSPLPEHIAKGEILESPSPHGMLVKRQIKAEVAGYPTFTTVTAWNPDGKLNAELKAQADKAERWLTLKNEQLLTGVKSATYDYELATGYAVWMLHCDDGVDEEGDEVTDPWALEVVDPDTAYFIEQSKGAYTPKMLAREYTMLVEDAKAKYPDADWNRLSLGRPVSGSGDVASQEFANATDKPAQCTFRALYTKDFTYHAIVRNTGQTQGALRGTDGRYASEIGELVWTEPNHTGGVPAVIVVGDLNESGGDGKKMVPIMLALLQVLANRNLINGLRMTLAVALSTPDYIIEANPQQFEAMRTEGMIKPASEEQLQAGAKAIYVNGKPTPYSPAPNEDLDKLDLRWEKEEQFCVTALTLNADSSTAAASTAEAYWIVNGVQNRQQTPMLQHLDEGAALIDRMILHSISEYDLKEGHPLYALKDQKRQGSSQIKRGEGVTLKASDLEFNYEVYVATKQETEEQRERRGAQVWLMYVQGRISWQQVLASDVSDVVEQLQELNEGAGLQVAANTLAPYLATMLNTSGRTRAGVNFGITPLNIAGAGAPAGPANGVGEGGSSWSPQPAPAASGGSAPSGTPMGAPTGPMGMPV